MDEAWHEDWLRAEGPLESARYRGLAAADALLERGRLGEGLRLLEEDRSQPHEATALRATWLVRMGAVDEARALRSILLASSGADGLPTPPVRVQLALLAEREGDTDAALLHLEHACHQWERGEPTGRARA